MKYNRIIALVFLAAISFVILAVFPFLGMQIITPAQLASSDLQNHIFYSLRLPRVLTAFIAGAGLSLCGMVFQAMFRNPLADPFTLGIASGASCGAAAVILLGITGSILGIPLLSVGAFCGAGLAMLLVYAIASFRRTSSNLTMLLAGIAVSFMFSSLLMFMQYLSSQRDSFHIIRWLMGGIEVFGYGPIITMLPFVGVGFLLIIIKLPDLDHLLVGEDIAKTRGVNVKWAKRLLLFAATLVVGAIVSVCGPIGFIGMMMPHLCRSMVGPNHRILGPASMLAGGMFLVVCDTIARTVIAPAEIPVGVITALLGGPFFLWILFGYKKGRIQF